jgi:hypothetical protein
MDYVAATALGLGGQSIEWLLSLDWHQTLRWYERATRMSGRMVKTQWEA